LGFSTRLSGGWPVVLLDSVLFCVYDSLGGALLHADVCWPGKELVVKDVETSPNTAVTMLGAAQSISWDRSGRNVAIQVPPLSVDEVPCQYAYVFEITHVK